jgi:hypothetical protein
LISRQIEVAEKIFMIGAKSLEPMALQVLTLYLSLLSQTCWHLAEPYECINNFIDTTTKPSLPGIYQAWI